MKYEGNMGTIYREVAKLCSNLVKIFEKESKDFKIYIKPTL